MTRAAYAVSICPTTAASGSGQSADSCGGPSSGEMPAKLLRQHTASAAAASPCSSSSALRTTFDIRYFFPGRDSHTINAQQQPLAMLPRRLFQVQPLLRRRRGFHPSHAQSRRARLGVFIIFNADSWLLQNATRQFGNQGSAHFSHKSETIDF